MERKVRYGCLLIFYIIAGSMPLFATGSYRVALTDNHYEINKFLFPPDSVFKTDTTSLKTPFPFEEEQFPYTGDENADPLFLKIPSGIQSDVEYDPITGQYILRHKMGDLDYRPPTYMTLEEYREYDLQNSVDEYWKERSQASGSGSRSGIISPIYIGGKAFDKIFGGNTIDIRPSGNVELIFQVVGNSRDDPTLDVKQRRQVNFDFQEKIQMNVIAKIGDKIEFKTNYNTEATFDFENKLNLRYEGDEDEIIQLLEAGDVSLPLNSTLITGSQSLFGIKSKLKFGKATVTTIFSEQESESSTITVQGGAQTNDFLLTANEYEENKHFFIAQYFRDHYEESLKDLPIVNTPVNITKIEVWVTNIGAAVQENRNIVAFTDIGEHDRIYNTDISPNFTLDPRFAHLPNNNTNNLFSNSLLKKDELRNINNINNYLLGKNFVSGEDFEKIELARKLSPNEYTFNRKLGFISLNSRLNEDQTLAVAFQYQVIGADSTVFQVGEFSDEGITGQDALIVKLLKSAYINIRNPIWDLMMKNVYSLNAYQINSEDFTLNILYSGDETGVPTGYFEEGPYQGQPLIQVFNLDNINKQGNPPPDAVFDFIDNAATGAGTINSSNGRVFFTVLEPFGSYLRKKLEGFPDLIDHYCYDSLYTLTKTGAEQFAEKNKFLISGYYKSQSGSEIALNALNVPQGSVTVTAGGVPLTENVDYTVDYTLGRVRIINEGILNSGTPINIKMESNSLFSIQTKRLMGTHIDYDITRNFHVGGTILNLSERPLTQKVNYGDDPISNTIWGLDYGYQTESRFITKMVDKLPFISTSAVSNITFDGEFAHFIPGHSKAVGKEGVSYIDDFEGTKSTIDLKNYTNWFLSSTPQFQQDLFPEAINNTSVSYGFNRARLAWYVIDPSVFYDRNSNIRPPNVDNEELSNNYTRQILETEVFPNREIPNGSPTNISILNVAFYPSERGAYNYNVEPTQNSAGINADGSLAQPDSRWGGMMRQIESSDFESANIEYIEFWMMDPFADGNVNDGNGGDLYINLGDISEDILKDGRKSYEHGLPISENINESEVSQTVWGIVPNKLDLVQSFSNEAGARAFQDVGYDGLRDADERIFFSANNPYPEIQTKSYLDDLVSYFGSSSTQAYTNAENDPSADNYHNYRGEDYDNSQEYSSVLNRYKRYNGPDGNSPENNEGGVYDGNTRQPNVEDLNADNTLSEGERYYQYRIQLNPNKMNVGENYITDIQKAVGIQLANGDVGSVNWYQFKIPIRTPDKVVGSISDFKSIRFMRMFMKKFKEPIVLRFATLDLVRGEWRRYPNSEDLLAPGEYIPSSSSAATTFDLSAVNIEENGLREPIHYVTPPGIQREVNIGTTNLTRLNEQAMVMNVCDLVDGDVAAGYKTAEFDFRQFKQLRMFVHAEKSREGDILKYGDMTIFIRIGSDFTQNYYEYEVPLSFTPWGTTNPDDIWPESNEINIDLERLANFKMLRNTAMRDPNSGVSQNFPYIAYDDVNKVTVLGSPSISDVKSMLIGIRNPKKTELTPDDDGEPKCAEVWVNELRLTNFNKQSGWASTGRVSMNLADLGNLAFSGTYSSPWFSSIDKKITEISLDAISQFDIATNLQLGKFFPEKSGIKVPLHFDYSEARIKPKYNPLDPDLELSAVLDTYSNEIAKDSIKNLTIDYTQRKNINLMNVRKDKTGAQSKSRVYDIENFDVSYSYSEIYHRNLDIERDMKQTYTGGLGYNFNNNPKNVKPFEKIDFISKSKALLLVKDFNFYFLPKMFSFRTDMTRMFNEKKMRNKSFGNVKTLVIHDKTWNWNRIYDLKFDLATSLTMNYNANAGSFINELPGRNGMGWDGREYGVDTLITGEQQKQQVKNEIKRGGTKTRYNQNAGINYNIPINKFPMLDWVTSTAGYQVSYSWTASPVSIQQELGNTIANNLTLTFNGNADLNKLYNKVGFLKNINQPAKKKPSGNKQKKDTQKVAPADSTKNKKNINYGKIAYETFFKLLMSVKKASFQYTSNLGTTIPGFMPEPEMVGNNWQENAPGMEFIFGKQPADPSYFNHPGWLSQSQNLNTAFIKRKNDNFNVRITIEPISDLKIELTADRAISNNYQSLYVYDTLDNIFKENSRMQTGTFSMSYITWGTAFGGSLANEKSTYFENLKEYRYDIAQRLASENPGNITTNDSTGYPNGYGPSSQYVLLPSFVAAYSGKSTSAVNLNPFPKIPLPNWRISYTGLSKIPFLQGIFKSVTVNHVYRSSYSIGSFTSNINFRGDTVNGRVYPRVDYENNVNIKGDFFPIYEMGMVSINEQFSPLINFDMTLQNSLLAKLEMKKSRILTMSFANNQLTEVSSDEFVIGTGYRFKDVPLSFSGLGGGGSRTFKSDLNIKADFSIRNTKTVLRSIDTELNQVSQGQKVMSINTSIDYMFSQTLTLRFFFDKIINNPYLPSQYRNSNTNGGFSLRFSLAQ